ncbi:hypothetical protein CERZMDRAFT_81388 [Cercospora zeae-maydis SCOH1-5]|uniref:Uncharacterized protein n=1 Tax=Cercospora zeae-maydis SCOH1-5 TaxID=717836 RepID=A0A6A6FS28_9PEZI|nr:hypothetical protein CERZMDRAFT_81388 [Cercospora zeae-maydis SCOH1-5]
MPSVLARRVGRSLACGMSRRHVDAPVVLRDGWLAGWPRLTSEYVPSYCGTVQNAFRGDAAGCVSHGARCLGAKWPSSCAFAPAFPTFPCTLDPRSPRCATRLGGQHVWIAALRLHNDSNTRGGHFRGRHPLRAAKKHDSAGGTLFIKNSSLACLGCHYYHGSSVAEGNVSRTSACPICGRLPSSKWIYERRLYPTSIIIIIIIAGSQSTAVMPNRQDRTTAARAQ